jgi:hypothetical protein
MSIRKWLTGLAVMLALIGGNLANGDVIFDNGVPDLGNAGRSDFNGVPNSVAQMADDFSLAPGQSEVTDAHWWGIYHDASTPSVPDAFTIRIFEDSGGVPEASPLVSLAIGSVSRSPTGDTIAESDVYAYSAQFAPISLLANTTYWLSIVNDTSGDDDDNWYWAMSGSFIDDGHSALRSTDEDSWTENVYAEFAFQLTNDVIPEPSTLVTLGGLLGIGLIGAWWRRKRKR